MTNVLPVAGIAVTLDPSCCPMHVIPRPHSIDKSMEKNNLSGSSFMFVYLNKTCYASIFSNMLSKYMYV